jgi:hypothetical protein
VVVGVAVQTAVAAKVTDHLGKREITELTLKVQELQRAVLVVQAVTVVQVSMPVAVVDFSQTVTAELVLDLRL